MVVCLGAGVDIELPTAKSKVWLFHNELGLALTLVFTLSAQSSVKLALGNAFPAGHDFLAAHRAAHFTDTAFSRIDKHIAAKGAIPEFRSHFGFLLNRLSAT